MTGTRPTALVRALAAVGAGVALAVTVRSAAAWAHPLGLPAFARIAATGPDEVTVVWNAAPDDVVALARSVGLAVGSDGRLTGEEEDRVSRSGGIEAALLDGISIDQDGRTCPGEVDVESLVGTGARLRFRCLAPVDDVSVRVSLLTDIDDRYRTLAVVGTTSGPVRWLFTAGAPERTFVLDPMVADEVLAAAQIADATPDRSERLAFGGSLPLESRFVALIDAPAGAVAVLVGLFVAFAVGAVHGLAPGHGKAIAAAYLVGDRGRPRDAVLLGGVVALMHTGSVLILGVALYGATRRPDTVALSGALHVVSGAVVAGLGSWLLLRRWRSSRGDRHRAAHQREAGDPPGHAHDHAHGHTHVGVLDEGVSPLSRTGLIGIGAAGGVLPSPSAMLVLFTALAVGRLAYGLTLIAAFSVGLAVTVSAVGLAALWGRDLVLADAGGWAAHLVRLAPVVAAAGVTGLGVLLVARGLTVWV